MVEQKKQFGREKAGADHEVPMESARQEKDHRTFGAEVKAYAYDVCTEIVDGRSVGDVFERMRTVVEQLHAIAHENLSDTDTDEEHGHRFQDAVEQFLDALLSYTHEYEEDGVETKESIVTKIKDGLFATSPNLINYLPVEREIRFAAKATRTPEFQSFIGSRLIGEISYNLAFAREEMAPALVEQIMQERIALQLDYLDLLERVGYDASGTEHEQRTMQTVAEVAAALAAHSEYPFVRAAAVVMHERIRAEDLFANVGVVDRTSQGAIERWQEELDGIAKEHHALQGSIQLDHPLRAKMHLVHVSEEYVGIADNNGRVHEVAEITRERIPDAEKGKEMADLRQALDAIDRRGPVISASQVLDILHEIDETVFADVSSEEIERIFGVLNADEWDEFSSLMHAVADVFAQRAAIEARYILQYGPVEGRRAFLNHMDSIEDMEGIDLGRLSELKAALLAGEAEGFDRLARVLKQKKDEADVSVQKIQLEPLEQLLEDPSVLPFGYTTLPDQQKLLIQQFHTPRIRAYFEQRFQTAYTELPLRSQLHLLTFLSEKDEGTFTRLEQILALPEIESAAFLKTFLACAVDHSIGDQLMAFAETAPPEAVNMLVAKYAEVVSGIEDIEGMIHAHFVEERAEQVDSRKAVQQILTRANRALQRIMNEDEQHREAAIAALDDHVVRFSALFRAAFEKDQQVEFSEMIGLDIGAMDAREISMQDKDRMLKIAAENWSKQDPTVAAEVLVGLQGYLSRTDGTKFRLLKKDGRVVGYVGFSPTGEPGHEEAHSFNVDMLCRQANLGHAFGLDALNREAEEAVLHGTVHPKIAIGTNYVEQIGFSITGVVENYKGTGVDFFEIECDRNKNVRSGGKELQHKSQVKLGRRNSDMRRMTRRAGRKKPLRADRSPGQYRQYVSPALRRMEEHLRPYRVRATQENLERFKQSGSYPRFLAARFHVQREHESMVDTVKQLLKAGYEGVRYYRVRGDENERVYVFERVKKTPRQVQQEGGSAASP